MEWFRAWAQVTLDGAEAQSNTYYLGALGQVTSLRFNFIIG